MDARSVLRIVSTLSESDQPDSGVLSVLNTRPVFSITGETYSISIRNRVLNVEDVCSSYIGTKLRAQDGEPTHVNVPPMYWTESYQRQFSQPPP